ncbi:von Willebrand factor A domain-containing protein 3A [Megalops cyprinoides]|uniref:von Willebrand factor A domain-containing protein 3A n=1 Tax=Megalops cyprinoides TaxID=118141 RepID=UPI00186462E8|nr:von Willebrand factor A domain-containing protein 3A [Megalops cyprinoides]
MKCKRDGEDLNYSERAEDPPPRSHCKSGHQGSQSSQGMAEDLDRKLLSAPYVAETNQSEPFWREVFCEADDGLLVTHVNHTHDLLRVQGLRGGAGDRRKSTAEWLEDHSVESSGLSLSHLLSHGTCTLIDLIASSCMNGRTDEEGNPRRRLEISAGVVSEFKARLLHVIELYRARIKWLTEGSLKVFGLVRGSRVGVLVDVADATCELGRLLELQGNLLRLIDEQLGSRKQLYPMSFGTEVSAQWNGPRDANSCRLREMCQWVQQLCPGGRCNLLGALKRALACRELDSLLIILGSSPDQTSDAFFNFVEQCTLGRELSVLAVAYGSSSHVTIGVVKRLAEVTGGRFHLFPDNGQGVVDSTDLDLMWREVKMAGEVLRGIRDMQQGQVQDMLVTVVQQISADLQNTLPLSHLLPKAANHDVPLCIQNPGFLPSTSADWLKSHGLKAQGLGLYQVLAPNAYSLLKEFVPILRKTVSSTVHEKAMVQFEWHDGTVKNVHVDLPLLCCYQKRLVRAVQVLEKRVAWLNSGSRQIWGVVCEQRVMLLVDLSQWNAPYLLHIQLSLRLLLEQQLANKHLINAIAFGGDMKPWREEMVEASPQNLQDIWRWVQGLQCEGSRNMLGALRRAVESDLQGAPDQSQGIYLFTSGIPDQDMAAVAGYISERCGGCDLRLHICLFGGGQTLVPSCPPPRFATPSETADALRNLAHVSGGRFHWFSETGIVESDDIKALMAEMEKAAGYWQKCSVLVESLTQRADSKRSSEEASLEGKRPALPLEAWRHRETLPPPRPTALTLARLQAKEVKGEDSAPQRALMWRPISAKAAIPPAQPMSGWRPASSGAKQRKALVSHSVFYTEEGNNLGFIFKKYPKVKSVRRSVPSVTLPKAEDLSSTKQWLKQFGIKALKLDLDRLASGPECAHRKRVASATQNTAGTKHCSVLPSIQINGTVKHLQVTPRELDQYLTQTERLLHRYRQRMQWLLCGSRRVFGTVLEQDVCILLDTSGSMATFLPEVTKELTSLIWDQLHRNKIRFTLLAFSGEVRVWRPGLTEPAEEACHDAVKWACQLCAHGGTCTLQALRVACGLGESLGCYLLSDGKPDSSCSLMLQEAKQMTTGRDITIHTISFNCKDSTANEFLRKLAHQTGGRFHCCQGDVDAAAASRKLMNRLSEKSEPIFPALEGDDLRRLAEEIDKLRHYRTQAAAFRKILLEKQNPLKN